MAKNTAVEFLTKEPKVKGIPAIPLSVLESASEGKLLSSLSDIFSQTYKGAYPPEGEYWVRLNDEIILKTKDDNEADRVAMDTGGISLRSNKTFYIFGNL